MAVLALVGLARLGDSDSQLLALPSQAAVEQDLFAPTPEPTRPPQPPMHRLAGVMPRSPDGLTYADGIPTGISTQPVFRVRDALLVHLGQTLLVGGWYHRPYCSDPGRNLGCTAATMSDVPLVPGQGDVLTSFIALDSQLDGMGAQVVLATVVDDPRCSIRDLGDCQPRLQVLAQMWSGVG